MINVNLHGGIRLFADKIGDAALFKESFINLFFIDDIWKGGS